MTMPAQWRGLRPDKTVLELIEDLKAAALKGQIRTIHVTVVTPDLRTQAKEAGDLDHVKAHLLAARLFRAAQKLLHDFE